jgi:type III restriction enzyme
LEIKGLETEQDRAKHQAAKRWVAGVNNWGKEGKWTFHVNKDPRVLAKEIEFVVSRVDSI